MVRITADQAQHLKQQTPADASQRFNTLTFHGGGPSTIAITSGKGGVGKTQLAANLAICFAHTGKRVLILDADLGLASLDLAFGVTPRWDLRDYLSGEKSIEEVLVRCTEGVDLLPACPGRYQMANLDLKDRTSLLNGVMGIADSYDILFIDTGAGIGSNAVSFAASANEIILVATPDPTSLRDAYAMAKVLHRRKGAEKICFIANQVRSEMEGIKIFEQLHNVISRFLSLKIEYLGSVPKDQHVSQSNLAGSPYTIGHPDSPATIATKAIASRVFKNLEAVRAD